VAIIFTPALCATMLKPVGKDHHHGEGGWLAGFFGWFNRMFARNTRRYESAVSKLLGRSLRFLAIYVAIIGVLVLLFLRMPTSFLPEEDQGVMFTQVILPAGATQERTVEVLKKIEHQYLENEKGNVRSIFAAAGFSFAGQGQNMGIGFVNLEPWDQRQAPGTDVKSIAGRAMGAFSQIKEAMVFAFVPPAVLELGTSAASTCSCRTAQAWATTPWSPRATSSSAWRRRTSVWSGCGPTGRRTSPSIRSTSTTRRPGRLAFRWWISTRHWPPPGAEATSTTSSTVAASRKFTCRQTPTRA